MVRSKKVNNYPFRSYFLMKKKEEYQIIFYCNLI